MLPPQKNLCTNKLRRTLCLPRDLNSYANFQCFIHQSQSMNRLRCRWKAWKNQLMTGNGQRARRRGEQRLPHAIQHPARRAGSLFCTKTQCVIIIWPRTLYLRPSAQTWRHRFSLPRPLLLPFPVLPLPPPLPQHVTMYGGGGAGGSYHPYMPPIFAQELEARGIGIGNGFRRKLRCYSSQFLGVDKPELAATLEQSDKIIMFSG